MNTSEAYELGVNAGYNAANYADAYGGGVECDPTLYSFSGPTEEFETGWTEGVRRFEDDEWPDGTPRTDDD